MSRPQVFGTVAGGDLANEKRCGFVRIKLEDGHVLTIPATGDQRDAGEIARLVDEYCRAQGWQPPRDGWELKLKPAPSEECAA